MTKKRAEKTTITLYDEDFDVISEENENLKDINESKFNLSSFVRWCLRNKSVLEEYKKTKDYLNQR